MAKMCIADLQEHARDEECGGRGDNDINDMSTSCYSFDTYKSTDGTAPWPTAHEGPPENGQGKSEVP